MSLKTQEEKELALRALEERKKEASKTERVRNDSLSAGAPMYYYCKFCGLLTDKLPEEHTCRPRQYCDECQKLKNAGWDGKEFVEYEWVNCGNCGGSGITCRRDYYTKRPRTCLHCDNGKVKRKKKF